MKKYINNVTQGNCIEILKSIPDDTLAGCITDPPYNYEFIGRNWDDDEIERRINRTKDKKSSTLVKNIPYGSGLAGGVRNERWYKKNRDNILDFTKRCRTKEGLFVYTPISYPPYIESIYSGVKIFETLGKIPENKESMVDFVLELQNNDGGFRRSIYMGISELEYTYRALYVLKTLSYL